MIIISSIFKKYVKISVFWIEVIGIVVILINLLLKANIF